MNDLQQVSTGCVTEKQQAMRVVAEVCSVYPKRNEALINAGVLALSRETSRKFPGFGRVVDHTNWNVGRISQEHGILCYEVSDASGTSEKVEECIEVGQKIMLHIQHACITAAYYNQYYIVDDDDLVIDIWTPWKGW